MSKKQTRQGIRKRLLAIPQGGTATGSSGRPRQEPSQRPNPTEPRKGKPKTKKEQLDHRPPTNVKITLQEAGVVQW